MADSITGYANLTRIAGLTLVLAFLLPGLVQAQLSNIQFTTAINNGQVTITGFSASGTGPLVIPDTINSLPVTGIDPLAFYNWTSITGVTIPGGVTTIGQGAFDTCTGLTAIAVDPSSSTYSSANGVLFDKNGTTLIRYPIGKPDSSYTTPNSVTAIGQNAFTNCSVLTSVTISSSVTSIGINAFSGCRGMTGITIPASVTTIAEGTFFSCESLGSVTIPNSVTSLGDGAFRFCYSLGSITIPDSVTNIGVGAFQYCSDLKCVRIGNGVTSIGINAFEYCDSLNKLILGNNVTTIGIGAFSGSTSLASVTIPASVTSIGDSAFAQSLVYVGGGLPTGSGVKKATFLGNAPTMGKNVFGYVTGLGQYLNTSNFTAYYYLGASGFASPAWTDSSGDTYQAYALTTFSQWETSHGISSAATAMPFHDGVPNLLKYLFDIDPTVPMVTTDRTALPTVGMINYFGTPYLTLTYRQNPIETGITVNVQTSSDLQTWTTVANPIMIQTGTDSTTGDPMMQVQVPVSGNKEFIRLNVTMP